MTLIKTPAIPEMRLRATQAGMSRLNRIGKATFPFERWTGIVSGGPFAAQPVKTVALAGTFIIKTGGKFTRFIKGTPQAVVMDGVPVEDERPLETIGLGKLPQDEKMENCAGGHLRNGRTARDVDNRFVFN